MPESRVFKWANDKSTTLNGTINNAVTSVVVTDGSVLPAIGPGEICTLVLRDDALGKFEILNVTSRSGNTLTVERGAEGTLASSWSGGTVITHSLTAAWFQARGFVAPVSVVEWIDSLCSYATSGSGTITMGIPAIAQAGDLLVLAAWVLTNTLVLTAPPGWNLLGQVRTNAADFDDEALRDTTGGQIVLAYRFMQLGDVSVDIPGGGTIFSRGGCVHAFRNVDTQRPFPQMNMTPVEQDNGDSNLTPYTCTPSMNRVGLGSLILSFSHARGFSGTTADVFDDLVIEPTGGFEELAVDGTSPTINAYITYMFSPGQAELENLLPYTWQNFSNWTPVNMVVADAVISGSAPIHTELIPTASTGRHEISYTVALSPGIHTFTVNTVQVGSTDRFLYLTVQNTDLSPEFGETYLLDSAGLSTVTFDSTVGAGFVRSYTKSVGQAGNVHTAFVVGCVFNISSAGSYILRIGVSQTSGTLSSTITLGTIEHWLSHVVLNRGEYIPPQWANLQTTGIPRLALAGTRSRIFGDVGSNGTPKWLNFALEIKSATDADDIRLVNNHPSNAEFSEDRLSYLKSGSGTGTLAPIGVATGCIDPWQDNASGKFYFEVTCDSSASWDASGTFAVGIGCPWLNDAMVGYTAGNFVDSDDGWYSYSNDGRIYANTVHIATIATYTIGDIIGVGVNLLTNEITFYKNGTTALHTEPLPAKHRLIPLRAMVSPATTNLHQRPYTINFKGPFSFLPSGFKAYDWENAP